MTFDAIYDIKDMSIGFFHKRGHIVPAIIQGNYDYQIQKNATEDIRPSQAPETQEGPGAYPVPARRQDPREQAVDLLLREERENPVVQYPVRTCVGSWMRGERPDEDQPQAQEANDLSKVNRNLTSKLPCATIKAASHEAAITLNGGDYE